VRALFVPVLPKGQYMKTEIEVKFLNIDIDDVRSKLTDAGAQLQQPMRLMKRALVEEPHHRAEHSFLRIRDEGDKVTLTFKRRSDPLGRTVDSVKEIEVTVSNFDDTVELFREAGWEYTTFQESKRETWHYKNVEVVIDEWPWIKPYIEIEGESENAIKSASEDLGFNWSDSVYGSVDVIYQATFPNMTIRGVIDVKEVRFDTNVPQEFFGESNGS
jgi:adenylate cyclase class 2